MKKINKNGEIHEVLFLVGLLLLFAVAFGSFFIAALQESNSEYEMPNGIICNDSTVVSKATHEFNGCSDNKTYINPESYREIKR